MDGVIAGASYRQLNDEIKHTLRRSASDVVLLGYLLRRMKEEKIWEVEYVCFDEYLKEELHIDYTMANRFMGIHKKYSAGGSKEIDVRWEGYSQAVLIEMLSVPPELESKITPDMTVQQVREIKRQANRQKNKTKAKANQQQSYKVLEAPEEPSTVEKQDTGSSGITLPEEIPDLQFREITIPEEVATSQSEKSAYGLDKTVYQEGSLLATEGCGHKYHCFSCAQDCGIRQKERYCRYAPLGNPFGCAMMERIKDIKEGTGDRCQFVNNDLAFHTAGSHEADPCCVECNEKCEYQCEKSIRKRDFAVQESDEDNTSEDLSDSRIIDELVEVKRILKKEQEILDDFLEVGGIPEKTVFKQKTIVSALTAMIYDLENTELNLQEEKGQPPLPLLKNAEQRKKWLRAYKDWGLWYRDDNIGAEYYKFDFENGARLIAEVYQVEATQYCDAYESCHLHLVGGPKPSMDQHGICKWTRHEHYNRYPNSETELVEFLKELQKKRDE